MELVSLAQVCYSVFLKQEDNEKPLNIGVVYKYGDPKKIEEYRKLIDDLFSRILIFHCQQLLISCEHRSKQQRSRAVCTRLAWVSHFSGYVQLGWSKSTEVKPFPFMSHKSQPYPQHAAAHYDSDDDEDESSSSFSICMGVKHLEHGLRPAGKLSVSSYSTLRLAKYQWQRVRQM